MGPGPEDGGAGLCRDSSSRMMSARLRPPAAFWEPHIVLAGGQGSERALFMYEGRNVSGGLARRNNGGATRSKDYQRLVKIQGMMKTNS